MAVYSKPASFMGIPAELRLRIYDFLLIPHLTTTDKDHDCCKTLGRHECYTRVCVCVCAKKNVFPKILATNKQIFNETMPVLYSNVEFAVSDVWNYQCSLERLPAYALPHITKIYFGGCFHDFLLSFQCGKFAGQYRFEIIVNRLLKLSHIRLHLRAFHSFYEERRVVRTSVALEKMGKVIARLPQSSGLQTVAVHVHEYDRNEDLAAKIVEAIEKYRHKLQTNLAVSKVDASGQKSDSELS